MSQRLRTPHRLNLETIVCEKYMARLLENELKIRSNPESLVPRSRERNLKVSCLSPYNKSKTSGKTTSILQSQKNMQSPKSSMEYSDDSALVKVTVKASNPRHRSRSRIADQEPWGQILKHEKSNQKLSLFSSFDPLRTLHFLIKELEFQLHRFITEGSNDTISQIFQDVQEALKRVPPEVASIINLQHSAEMIEKLKFSEKETQTIYRNAENDSFKIEYEENIKKLKIKYEQMENLCSKIKEEKYDLEKQLEMETESIVSLKKKIKDLEENNDTILTSRLKNLEKEKEKLESEIECLTVNYDTRYSSLSRDLTLQIDEIKNAKLLTEQENMKLKQQIRIMNIEKEKYLTVLAARDRQISEIRGEMTNLQEAVNEQLKELQKNALKTFSSTPSSTEKIPNEEMKKENIGDWSVSNSRSYHNQLQKRFSDNSNLSFRDLPSGDIRNIENLVEAEKIEEKANNFSHRKQQDYNDLLENIDSHTSIRTLFNEVKRTALSISAAPSYELSKDKYSKQ